MTDVKTRNSERLERHCILEIIPWCSNCGGLINPLMGMTEHEVLDLTCEKCGQKTVFETEIVWTAKELTK